MWLGNLTPVSCRSFLESCGRLFPYIFLPFNLVGRVLKKIEDENVKAIIVVPYWRTQARFPTFLSLWSDPPVALSSRGHPLLSDIQWDRKELPNTKRHVALTCANPLGRKTFQQQHGKSSWPHAKAPQGNNTTPISDSGSMRVRREIDPTAPSLKPVMAFLSTLFDRQLGYSALNTAKSAISNITWLPCRGTYSR